MIDKPIHKLLLQMLEEIDQICKKHNITYYAAGGTTIGAIRHRGFIPWDDDADVYMTRSEFARFRVAFEKEKPEHRALECLETNPDYPATIPRYINTQTTNIAKFNVLDTCASGLVIDIFILDPIPNDPEGQRRQRNLLNIYSDFVNPYYGYSYRCDDDYMKVYWDYLKLAKKSGKQAVRDDLEKQLFALEESESDYYMLRWATVPHVFPKEMIGEPLHMPYEDMEIPIPHGWYDYLVMLYGVNWFEIPNNIEEQGHTAVTNLQMPYDIYMKDAGQYIDKDEIYDALIERKEALVKYTEMRRPYMERELEAKSRYIRHKIGKRLAEKNLSIEEMYRSEQFGDILDLFDDYIEAQFSEPAIGARKHTYMYRFYNPILMELDEDHYHYLLRSMIYSNMVGRANRLLDIIDKKKGLTSDLIEVRSDLASIFDIVKEYYTGDTYRAYEMIGELPSHLRDRVLILKRIELGIAVGSEKIQIDEQMLLQALDDYEGDIEIKKVLGDYYWDNGKETEAKALYEEVCQTCRNGMLLLDIEDRVGLVADFESKSDFVDTEKNEPTGEIEKRYFQLLVEVDTICRNAGISYSLARGTLMYGATYHRFENETHVPTVMMKPSEARRFIEEFNRLKPENRELDHMANNDEQYEFTIRYCDTTTSRINLRRNIYNNMQLRIIILEQIPKNAIRAKIDNWLEKTAFIDSTRHNPAVKGGVGIKGKIASPASRVLKLFYGGGGFYDKFFDYKLNRKEHEGRYVFLENRFGRHERYGFPSEIMDDLGEIQIYGHDFFAVADYERYLASVYGKYYTVDMEDEIQSEAVYMITDPKMMLQEVESVIGEGLKDCKERKLFEDAYKYTIPNIASTRKSLRGFRKIERTDSRIRLAQKYVPMKKEILRLYEEGKYDRLEKILEDYDREAREFNKSKLALYFDEDIFRVYAHLLEIWGEDEMKEQIEEYIETEELKPLNMEGIL